jgi:hypothetical protein
LPGVLKEEMLEASSPLILGASEKSPTDEVVTERLATEDPPPKMVPPELLTGTPPEERSLMLRRLPTLILLVAVVTREMARVGLHPCP